MKAEKTIKAKVFELRRGRKGASETRIQELSALFKRKQICHSPFFTRQQANRLLKGLEVQSKQEVSAILRRDVYRANIKLTPYWLKSHLWRQRRNQPSNKTHEPITEDMVYREAKIIRKATNSSYI